MRHALLLLAFLLAVPIQAQVTDTLAITIGPGLQAVQIVEIGPGLQVRAGQRILFTATALDETGAVINDHVLYTWASSDATILSFDPDSAGLATAHTAGPVEVYVLAELLEGLFVAAFRDGALDWSGHYELDVGDTQQFCAYLLAVGNKLVAESPGPPACPILGLSPNDGGGFAPHLAALFGRPSRVVPWARLASVLQVQRPGAPLRASG